MSLHREPAAWWISVAVLCLVGLGVATYLTVTSFSTQGPACGLVPGCKEVAASKYSEIAGFPVAAIGVMGYSAMLLAILSVLGLDNPPEILRVGLIAAAVIASIFSIYLTVLEFTVIDAMCIYCMTSAVASWLILVSLLSAEWADRSRNI